MPRRGSLVIVIISIAFTAHAQEAIAPFVPPNASSVSGNVFRGQLLWGRTDGGTGRGRDEGVGVRARGGIPVLRHVRECDPLPVGARSIDCGGPEAARGVRLNRSGSGSATAPLRRQKLPADLATLR